MTTTPPGWYDDGHGALRWWDGAQWTEHVAEPDPEPAADEAGEAPVLPPELAADLDPAVAMSAGVPSPAEVPDYAAYGATGTQQPYAGAYAPVGSGAFVSATEPKKSRGWIIWVVVGVALLALVVAAAVLIPLALLSASTSGSSQPGSSTVVVEETADVSGADELAAVETVTLYDTAWQTVDCDSFVASTTPEFRTVMGYDACDAFVEDASAFADGVDDYVVHIEDVVAAGDGIGVATSETYTSMYDADGQPADTPQSYEDRYQYSLVAVGDGWAIDDIVFE